MQVLRLEAKRGYTITTVDEKVGRTGGSKNFEGSQHEFSVSSKNLRGGRHENDKGPKLEDHVKLEDSVLETPQQA